MYPVADICRAKPPLQWLVKIDAMILSVLRQLILRQDSPSYYIRFGMFSNNQKFDLSHPLDIRTLMSYSVGRERQRIHNPGF